MNLLNPRKQHIDIYHIKVRLTKTMEKQMLQVEVVKCVSAPTEPVAE